MEKKSESNDAIPNQSEVLYKRLNEGVGTEIEVPCAMLRMPGNCTVAVTIEAVAMTKDEFTVFARPGDIPEDLPEWYMNDWKRRTSDGIQMAKVFMEICQIR